MFFVVFAHLKDYLKKDYDKLFVNYFKHRLQSLPTGY